MTTSPLHVPAALQQYFAENPRVALAFSGGVDSAYLLYAALACGSSVRAYYIHTQFQPAFELEDARRLAQQLSADMRVIELDVLQNSTVTANPADRCYHCKHTIFHAILQAAQADGFTVLMDGTNASDDSGDRPGMRALQELQVHSPLRMCGITKPEIRSLSKEAGLFTWDKPAYACLATRIPTGTAIDADTLQRVEQAESALFALGFTDFRVRVLKGAAKLQVPLAQFPRVLELRQEILAQLSPCFKDVLFDLNPR